MFYRCGGHGSSQSISDKCSVPGFIAHQHTSLLLPLTVNTVNKDWLISRAALLFARVSWVLLSDLVSWVLATSCQGHVTLFNLSFVLPPRCFATEGGEHSNCAAARQHWQAGEKNPPPEHFLPNLKDLYVHYITVFNYILRAGWATQCINLNSWWNSLPLPVGGCSNRFCSPRSRQVMQYKWDAFLCPRANAGSGVLAALRLACPLLALVLHTVLREGCPYKRKVLVYYVIELLALSKESAAPAEQTLGFFGVMAWRNWFSA